MALFTIISVNNFICYINDLKSVFCIVLQNNNTKTLLEKILKNEIFYCWKSAKNAI